MTIMIETVTPPESGEFNVELQLRATIRTTAEVARKQVSIFVGNQIADLLSGAAPSLLLRESGTFWHVPVILSSRSLGRTGPVGAIDVAVESGELVINDAIIEELKDNARRLAASTAL